MDNERRPARERFPFLRMALDRRSVFILALARDVIENELLAQTDLHQDCSDEGSPCPVGDPRIVALLERLSNHLDMLSRGDTSSLYDEAFGHLDDSGDLTDAEKDRLAALAARMTGRWDT